MLLNEASSKENLILLRKGFKTALKNTEIQTCGMLRYLLPVVFLHSYFKASIQKRISNFYSISRQKIDFFLHRLLLSIFLQYSLISTFRLSSLTQYPVTCISFSSLHYRTVICLRLVEVGNDLAENFPWEPLDGRCLHKSSWEIIVTCCLAPMLEEQRYS